MGSPHYFSYFFKSPLENLTSSLKGLAPHLAEEMAMWGVYQLGEQLGVDPRISQVAGIGVSTSISGMVRGNTASQIWQGVKDGVTRGITSVGLQWAGEELDMGPFLSSISTATVVGLFKGALSGNPLQGVYDTYFQAGTGLLTLGGMGNDEWSKSAYMARVLNFSDVIQEQGIETALETYSTSFLNSTTIENIWGLGGIKELLANAKQIETIVTDEGEIAKRVYTDEEKEDYIDLSADSDELLGYKQGNIEVKGEFIVDLDDRLKPKKAQITTDLGGMIREEIIEDFGLAKIIERDKASGEIIREIEKRKEEESIKINSDGSIKDGIERNKLLKYTLMYKDSQLINMWKDNTTQEDDWEDLVRFDISKTGGPESGLHFRALPEETYQTKITLPLDIFEREPYNVPINTNSEDNGSSFKDLEIESVFGLQDFTSEMFSMHKEYNPGTTGKLEEIRDYFDRLYKNGAAALAGKLVSKNSDPEMNVFWRQATSSIAKQLAKECLEGSNTELLISERLKLKEIGNEIAKDLDGALIYDFEAGYDKITIDDVEEKETDSTLMSLGKSIIMGLIGKGFSTLVIPEIDILLTISTTMDSTTFKKQPYDPTQTRYQGYYIFSDIDSESEYPKYKVNFDFRVGQYKMDDGTIGFGVVQGTYEKAEAYKDYYGEIKTRWESPIKSHEGEWNDYKIDKFYW